MRALKFLAALAAVYLVHLVAVRLVPAFPRAVDLFLVLLVLNALDGKTLQGMLGGLAAGWLEDAVTGAPYGLHGVAGAVAGYTVARAVQQFEVQNPAVLGLMFSLAATLHQVLLVALVLLLMPDPPVPEPAWVAVKVLSCGVLGAALSMGVGVLRRRLVARRQSRVARVRI